MINPTGLGPEGWVSNKKALALARMA